MCIRQIWSPNASAARQMAALYGQQPQITGRWLLAHGGMSISPNNQGLSRGYQVHGQNAM